MDAARLCLFLTAPASALVAASTETKSICLVGKGIVYDTGGLSLKDKTSMPGMKIDMGVSHSSMLTASRRV